MGAFVLGILVGWLLEWLFFTFWIKGRSSGKFADCTSLKAELETKNKEISALKSHLESTQKALERTEVVKSQSNATKKQADTKAESVSTSTSGTSTVASKPKDKEDSKGTKKETAKKETTAKEKNKPVKKAAAKKPTEKNNQVAKKPVAKKAPAKKSSTKTAKNTPAKKAKKGDDLTKLSGIGPSMASKLKELGIDTFKKLADMDDDILRDMLEASGARLNNNKEAMDTWNEQAALADKGDFDGLKKLQEMLKK